MEKSMYSLRMEDKNSFADEHTHDVFKCDECRSEFHKPLLATVASHGRNVDTYYACPRCLTKVDNVKERESKENSEISFSMESIKKPKGTKLEAEVKCKHFVGYLKKREKDAAIPDECLTCEKMIECMVR